MLQHSRARGPAAVALAVDFVVALQRFAAPRRDVERSPPTPPPVSDVAQAAAAQHSVDSTAAVCLPQCWSIVVCSVFVPWPFDAHCCRILCNALGGGETNVYQKKAPKHEGLLTGRIG